MRGIIQALQASRNPSVDVDTANLKPKGGNSGTPWPQCINVSTEGKRNQLQDDCEERGNCARAKRIDILQSPAIPVGFGIAES
jgi:hypothetical protein